MAAFETSQSAEILREICKKNCNMAWDLGEFRTHIDAVGVIHLKIFNIFFYSLEKNEI
jgi:hypothetical protein